MCNELGNKTVKQLQRSAATAETNDVIKSTGNSRESEISFRRPRMNCFEWILCGRKHPRASMSATDCTSLSRETLLLSRVSTNNLSCSSRKSQEEQTTISYIYTIKQGVAVYVCLLPHISVVSHGADIL